MNLEKYLFLNIRKTGIIILAFVIALAFHNLIYALSGLEEPVFFLLATLVIPFYFLISIIYTIFHHVKKHLKKKAKKKK